MCNQPKNWTVARLGKRDTPGHGPVGQTRWKEGRREEPMGCSHIDQCCKDVVMALNWHWRWDACVPPQGAPGPFKRPFKRLLWHTTGSYCQRPPAQGRSYGTQDADWPPRPPGVPPHRPRYHHRQHPEPQQAGRTLSHLYGSPHAPHRHLMGNPPCPAFSPFRTKGTLPRDDTHLRRGPFSHRQRKGIQVVTHAGRGGGGAGGESWQ